MELAQILKKMTDKKASDLILKVGNSACFRIDGELYKEEPLIREEDMEVLVREIMHHCKKQIYKDKGEMVTSFGIKDIGRFRVTIYNQRGTGVVVIRSINTHVPSFEELSLPAKVLSDLCNEKRGLVLITGTTGSGKSTTVASMLEFVNNNMAKHIVTLEDPIEFLFKDKQSIVSQREIKVDTDSFQNALEYIMLQTPDVIFIGDIRNAEVMSTALTAAETGQLVIANLHTINTTHTIERIVNFFQPHQHQEIRIQLSMLLKGVISLRLVPLKSGSGRYPVCEILMPTPTIVELIRENKIEEIEYYIKDGDLFGMQTFDRALLNLYKEGLITEETVISYAERKNEVLMSLKELR